MTSPRPRAAYSSWMLADWGSERLARLPDEPLRGSDVASSVAKAAVQARSRMARAAERGLVIDDEQVAVEVRGGSEGLEQVGGGGRDVGHRSVVSWVCGRARQWYGRGASHGRGAFHGAACRPRGGVPTHGRGGVPTRRSVSARTLGADVPLPPLADSAPVKARAPKVP